MCVCACVHDACVCMCMCVCDCVMSYACMCMCVCMRDACVCVHMFDDAYDVICIVAYVRDDVYVRSDICRPRYIRPHVCTPLPARIVTPATFRNSDNVRVRQLFRSCTRYTTQGSKDAMALSEVMYNASSRVLGSFEALRGALTSCRCGCIIIVLPGGIDRKTYLTCTGLFAGT